MMKILRELLGFFGRERLYVLLILFIGAFYAFITLTPPKPAGPKTPVSQAVQTFKEAETQFERKTFREENYQDFAAEQPVRAALFEGMTVFFLLALCAGLVLDVLILVIPSWRREPAGAPPEVRTWPLAILLKTVILFLVWGILLSVVLGVLGILFKKTGFENFAMVLHTFLIDVLCVYFMVRFLKQQGSRGRELGFQAPGGKILPEVGVGFLGYLAILPVFAVILVILIFISGLIGYEPPPHPLVNVFLEEEKRQPLLVAFSVFLGVVGGPVFEEIFFRGFCYPILRSRIGKFWGMTVSAAFFAGIHHSGFAFWPIFVLGMALAYLYETRRSLYAPITMHIVHNAIFIGYFFLFKQVIGWSAS